MPWPLQSKNWKNYFLKKQHKHFRQQQQMTEFPPENNPRASKESSGLSKKPVQQDTALALENTKIIFDRADPKGRITIGVTFDKLKAFLKVTSGLVFELLILRMIWERSSVVSKPSSALNFSTLILRFPFAITYGNRDYTKK